MIRILILSVGTNASYHVIKTLREKFPKDFYIVGADINPRYLVSTANLVDSFYQVPYSSNPNYYNVILEICKKEKIKVLLPSFDTDQKLFYPENNDLQNLNILSLGTAKESLDVYIDKHKMNTFLMQNGFPVPQVPIKVNFQHEYFMKPKNGVGSIGTQKILGSQWDQFCKQGNFLLQELCHGPEITLECFHYHSKLSCVARERISTKAGVCVKTRIYNDESLKKIAKHFVRVIKSPLCFNLQFMKDQTEKFVITDVNFRLAGGMSLSSAIGWDTVSAIAKILLKKKGVWETLPRITTSHYVVRAYTDIVTKEENPIVAFDWDGTLLDSRERHKIVLNDVLKQYGIQLDVSNLIEFKRYGKNNIDFLIARGIDKNLALDIQRAWIKNIESQKYLSYDQLYAHAITMLEKYSRHNDLMLLTARKNTKALFKQIRELNVEKYFTYIKIVNTTRNVKDEKAKVLKKYNVHLMIGDTESDALAARKAGAKFLHIDTGFHNKTLIKYHEK